MKCPSAFLSTVTMQNGCHLLGAFFSNIFRLTKGRVKARQRKMHQVRNINKLTKSNYWLQTLSCLVVKQFSFQTLLVRICLKSGQKCSDFRQFCLDCRHLVCLKIEHTKVWISDIWISDIWISDTWISGIWISDTQITGILISDIWISRIYSINKQQKRM